MAPQPREWFAGVDDESILRLLDPLEQRGTPDTATPVAWREHIRSSGRTPNGVWGGKLMWNQTALLRERASQLPDRSGDGLRAAIRDVIGSEPVYVHVHRPDVVSQAVSFWRAVQTRVWRGHPDPERDSRAVYHAGAIAHMVKQPARSGGQLARLVRSGVDHADRHLVPGVVAQPHRGCRPRSRSARAGSAAGAATGAGTAGRSALRRVGRPLPCGGAAAGATHLVTVASAAQPGAAGRHHQADLPAPPTSATTNTRRNGKIVVPSARGG